MKMINLGCGRRLHKDWTNLDFYKSGDGVIVHNLLNNIPFGDNEFDVVYHSHVLEHFSKADAVKFIAECYRVLKPGGIIRIAVPDLEQIAREYVKQLDKSLLTPDEINNDYEWMVIEMYDQTVRNYPGGEMGKTMRSKDLSNKDFILKRMGHEAIVHDDSGIADKPKLLSTIKAKVKHILHSLKRVNEAKKIGKFRLQGEIHQWMYDQYSLGLLLKKAGFVNCKKVTAFESKIENWDQYGLETINGDILKPDSLFMEGSK